MISRLALALLTVVLALAACSNRSPGTGNATPGSGAPPGDGTASAPAEGTPMNEIQTQLAATYRVAAGDVKVRLIDGPAIPGAVAFSASIDPKKLGRHASTSGVLVGKKILTEKEAMSAVARAWGYGAKRTVSAVDVATVFAPLHSADVGVTAFTDADTLAAFRANAFPEQAAAAILPTEVVVDGLLAVKYCITSGGSIPFSVVTAVFRPDSTVDLRVEPVGQQGQGERD